MYRLTGRPWAQALLTVVAVGIICASPAWAQLPMTPPAERVRIEGRIQSTVPAEIAWGAFEAAQLRLTVTTPLIVSRLGALPDTSDRNERYWLVATLLDSLIQLNARIRADAIRPFYREYPIHVLVLLGDASEGRDTALLDILGESTGERWFAAANMLMETRPAGFAAALLDKFSVELQIGVTDDGNESGMSAGLEGVGGGVGDGVGQLPEGFPPVALYRLGGLRGALVLAHGTRPVYYTRSVVHTFQFGMSETFTSGPSRFQRAQYLNELLRSNRTFSSSAHATIRWTGPRAFRAAVRDERRIVEERMQRAIGALLQAHLLTELEARTIPIPIDTTINDERSNKTTPLPNIE